MRPSGAQGRQVRIWDLPVRLFHWALVLCLALSWWTAETGRMGAHLWLGYTALALVAFRLLWGLVGSETARFRHFVKGPVAVLHHVRTLASPGPLPREVGHNPLGALAVLGLLLAVLVQAVSGLFTNDGILAYGPLSELVSADTAKLLRRVHFQTFDILLVLVGLHVAAIIGYRVVKGLDLVRPMLTGRAEMDPPLVPPRLASPWLALPLAALAVLLVWAVITIPGWYIEPVPTEW